jgi:hypothetical protein
MNWDGYEIYHPGVFGPLDTLPRAEARRAFKQLMQAKPGRIEMLGRLLNARRRGPDVSAVGEAGLTSSPA